MVNRKPVYIVAGLVAILGMISFSSSGHFSAFAQGSDVKVSIPAGASTATDPEKQWSPNTVNVKVGQKVVWTNNDNVAHTAVSGTDANDPAKGKEFDSGLTKLINPGGTFEHAFTKAGTFPYFCELHPQMKGKVVVS
jgi:plastocyanin